MSRFTASCAVGGVESVIIESSETPDCPLLQEGVIVILSRRASGFLLAVGAWHWLIWPVFLRNVWRDERSFASGPTSFLLVHLALTVASLAIGTALGLLGWRGLGKSKVDRAS